MRNADQHACMLLCMLTAWAARCPLPFSMPGQGVLSLNDVTIRHKQDKRKASKSTARSFWPCAYKLFQVWDADFTGPHIHVCLQLAHHVTLHACRTTVALPAA